jgi:hypothetical protein
MLARGECEIAREYLILTAKPFAHQCRDHWRGRITGGERGRPTSSAARPTWKRSLNSSAFGRYNARRGRFRREEGMRTLKPGAVSRKVADGAEGTGRRDA